MKIKLKYKQKTLGELTSIYDNLIPRNNKKYDEGFIIYIKNHPLYIKSNREGPTITNKTLT